MVKGYPLEGSPGRQEASHAAGRVLALACLALLILLVPDLTGFRQLRVRPTDAREIADAFNSIGAEVRVAEQHVARMLGLRLAI